MVAGVAGASARREHERRRAIRAARIRRTHPRTGGVLLALTSDPQATAAWAAGARGEELLAGHLDKLVARGVWLLHDRRIPGSRANIDHLAVAAGGVFVIDAKNYTGRPLRRVDGGWFGPRVEKLIVGGRDRTRLIEGVHRQVDLVRDVLDRAGHDGVPVTGTICFVGGDWPLIGAGFTIAGVQVLPPKKLTGLITSSPVHDKALAGAVRHSLAAHFLPA